MWVITPFFPPGAMQQERTGERGGGVVGKKGEGGDGGEEVGGVECFCVCVRVLEAKEAGANPKE